MIARRAGPAAPPSPCEAGAPTYTGATEPGPIASGATRIVAAQMSDPGTSAFDERDPMDFVGEFRDPRTEAAFSAATRRQTTANATICIVATTFAVLSFAPLDVALIDPPELFVFLGIRALLAIVCVVAMVVLGRRKTSRGIVVTTHVQQFLLFTLNALIFDHPSLPRHGGLLLPLIAIALPMFLPGRFRTVALTSAYAPSVSLLFWGVLRPQPEAPLDLAVIVLVTSMAFVVGLAARRQWNRMRREEFLRIARERRTNRALREAKEAAEAGARAKADFLAVMSHEIRTPMNGILGMVRLVLDDVAAPRTRERLGVVLHSAEVLRTILDDVLDLSQLELGRQQYERVPVDLAGVVGDVVDLVRPQADEKGIALVVEIADDVPERVSGDPARLRQILINLVGNAVKFTRAGRVAIAIRRLDDGSDRLEFSVSDSGIGIAPADVERLFAPFTQADASIRRRFGGTGLGLAISRRLVEGMGGDIGVESLPGVGSRFHFRIAAPAVAAPTPVAAETIRPTRSLRLLLVEDNPINRLVAQGLLERAGHVVTAAASGEEALALVEAGGFDVVLMDLQMPGLDGFETARRIRALPGPTGAVPIVALSANVLETDVSRALEAGMNGHVAKPIDPARLEAVLAGATAPGDPRTRRPPAPGDDVLLVAARDEGTAGRLAVAGLRVFPTRNLAAAANMLEARAFAGLVVVAPDPADHPRLRALAGRVPFVMTIGAATDDDGVADVRLPADADEATVIGALTAMPTGGGETRPSLDALFAPQVLRRLETEFAEHLGRQAERLRGGVATPDELRAIAHVVKGSAANMGRDALAAVADAVGSDADTDTAGAAARLAAVIEATAADLAAEEGERR